MQVTAAPRALPPTPSLVTAREAAARVRAVQRGIKRLGELDSLWRVVAAVPAEACAAVGIDRTLLSHLRDGVLRFAGASYEDDPGTATDFLRLARALQPSLSDCGPEQRAATTHEPVLVRGAQDADDVFRLLVSSSQTRAYVVAPIVVEAETVGLLHGDRFTADGEVDQFDAELLALFADGVAGAMRRFMGAAARREPAVAPLDGAVGPFRALTDREREILGLMTEGASNARIAERLVISEATVKTHVRHILRKLEAANRTEAVSRYHAFIATGAV